jgi:hypothetical protein
LAEKKKSKSILPKEEPLFVKFLNSKISEEYVTNLLEKLGSVFNDESDKVSVNERKESFKEHHLEAFRLVQKKFKDHIDHIMNFKKFDKDFGQWANFYLSSLREIKEEDKKGNIQRFVKIGDANGDWITGIILYNFSLFCKYYGTDLLKNCQSCGSYFTIKGKYAKFCSDSCKKSEKPENAVDL